MYASSIIRAGGSAYPAGMCRLILVLAVTTLGVLVYRRRCIERWEQELAIGPHAHDTP